MSSLALAAFIACRSGAAVVNTRELLKAARDGEGFDPKRDGLPTSMLQPEPDAVLTWLEFAAS